MKNIKIYIYVGIGVLMLSLGITIGIMANKIEKLNLKLGIKEAEMQVLLQSVDNQNKIIEQNKLDSEKYRKESQIRINDITKKYDYIAKQNKQKSIKKPVSDGCINPEVIQLQEIEEYIRGFNEK